MGGRGNDEQGAGDDEQGGGGGSGGGGGGQAGTGQEAGSGGHAILMGGGPSAECCPRGSPPCEIIRQAPGIVGKLFERYLAVCAEYIFRPSLGCPTPPCWTL